MVAAFVIDLADELTAGRPGGVGLRRRGTTAHQITEYLGDEAVEVDGRLLTARHTRWTTVFSRAPDGTAVIDDWLNPGTDLVLKERRNIGL